MSSLSDFIGSGVTKVWASGMTVKQWEVVTSQQDGMPYQRKTATGSGTTDPYSDRTNYRPAFTRLSSITSSSSAGTLFSNSGAAANEFTNLAVHSFPALSAGVRTNMLSLTGRGALRFIGLAATAAIASLRVEVLLDGVTIFDATYTSLTSTSRAIQIGYLAQINTNCIAGPDLVEFTNAAQVFFTASTNQAVGNVRFCSSYVGYQS
ncbi:hypothetical protein [Diaphorobacter nitroreducens]